ncbi:MAG: MBL fold metallo-hydrolase [Vicinamibacterales bacterium]
MAAAFLHAADGITIVDPGPSSSLPRLRAQLNAIGASMDDVTTLFLTHIHLDHAGATGSLVRENPRLKVVVHEVGAPHMVNPAKLLASAGRLYGDQMQQLWGDVLPVPASSLHVVSGGERLTAGGRYVGRGIYAGSRLTSRELFLT